MTTADLPHELQQFLNDPDRAKYAQSGDPHTWQQRFEDQIEVIGRQGAELSERIQQVEAEARDHQLSVRVGAGGTLLGVAFAPGAAKLDAAKLSEAFLAQYTAASADADAQVREIVAGSGLPVTDFDPFAPVTPEGIA